jgi:hypothetical protein
MVENGDEIQDVKVGVWPSQTPERRSVSPMLAEVREKYEVKLYEKINLRS